MKSKQLVILIVLAAVLGGAVWVLNKDSKNAWSDTVAAAGGKAADFPINDVARVTIHASAGTVNLVRKDDAWVVEERADYPADAERVVNLLRKLWDMKSVQELQVGPSQFARFELVEPAEGVTGGTKVEFKDKDGKSVGGLLLGKKYMKKSDGGFVEASEFPAGRYVMKTGGKSVSLVSETLDDVDPKVTSWLKRDFIKVENPSAVTLAGATDAQKWKLTRENATTDWKLEGAKENEKVDTAKVSQFGSVLQFASFTDVLKPDAKPEETGLDKPALITFETFDGFKYVLKTGKADGDNVPVMVEVSGQFPKERTPGKDEKPEDKTKLDEEFKTKLKGFEDKLAAEKKFEGRPFLMSKSTVEQLLKDRAALLAEDKPAAPAGGAPLPGGMPPTPSGPGVLPPGAPPFPGTPGASTPPPPARQPISVTTPPISVESPSAVSAPVASPKPGAPEKPNAAPEKPATPETKPAAGDAKPATGGEKPASPGQPALK